MAGDTRCPLPLTLPPGMLKPVNIMLPEINMPKCCVGCILRRIGENDVAERQHGRSFRPFWASGAVPSEVLVYQRFRAVMLPVRFCGIVFACVTTRLESSPHF